MNKTSGRGFYTAAEIATYIGCSRGHAYKVVKRLNDELKVKGYITVAGKVSRAYFDEKYYGNVGITSKQE